MSNVFGKLRNFMTGLERPDEEYEYEYDYGDAEGEDYQKIYKTEHSRVSPEAQLPAPTFTQTGPGAGMNSDMSSSMSMNNVVPGASKWWGAVAEVIVIVPRSFEEMPHVITALKERKSVVLNLTMMEQQEAQRSVDFIAGATFTIDGQQERIGESIFLFTPSCVQVSTNLAPAQEQPTSQASAARPPAPTTAWANAPMPVAQ